jgi:hypothetical protein
VIANRLLLSFTLVGLVACGNKDASGTSSSTASASSATSPPGSSATTAASAEKESVDVLREKATKVMDALKKGDAKAVADYCLIADKRESVAKTVQEELQQWPKRYQNWDGKFSEIKSAGVMTYLAVGEEDHGGPTIVALAFLRQKGVWSLDDQTPMVLVQKADWDKFGATLK